VITFHCEKPGLTQQLKAIQDARPTVNEVAHADESIFGAVEAKLVQSAVEIDSFEVDVANNEVTSNLILWKSQHSLIHAGSTLKQCVTQQVTEPVLSDFRRPVPIKREVGSVEMLQWFVDFEASGIAPDSYPIEIAVVSADAEYQSLIRPARYWTHWSFDAQDMHQISRDHLLADGLDPGRVTAELNKLFKGARLCSDSPQDVFWLDTLYDAAGLEPTFQLLPLESFVGRIIADQIYRALPPRRQHRALPDARELMSAALACMNK
jgi:hypothetical protein